MVPTSMPVTPVRPKLLFLSQTLPFPPDGGVNIRTFNVLRLLARQFDIVMLCFYRAQDRITSADVSAGLEGLSPFAHAEAFPIPQESSRARLIGDHVRSVLLRQPYTRYAYASTEFRERLRYWLEREEFALVHMDSLDLVEYLPELEKHRVVCVHHNVESALLRRRAATERSRVRRWYLMHQAGLVEATERHWCERVTLNIAVSPNDRDDLRRIAPRGRYAIVPNGVDTEYFHPVQAETHGVVFVGGANWFPNRDALDYFCATILPEIRRSGFDPEVRWVGRATEVMQREYAARHGVELTGYVPDVRPIVQQAACYVAPLRVGGGTRLKILDAWAMSKAVVSTSIGCEGLEAEDGRNILIRDDPAGFAHAVVDVLSDATLRKRLESGARATAEALYSWDVIGDDMSRQYADLLQAPAMA